MSTLIRTYSELITLPTFEERFEYLKLGGVVGRDTFGFDRYLNQLFYTSGEWKECRDQIIIRDLGCDLAVPDLEIKTTIYVHHMNPILLKDITDRTEFLLNPEYLVCTSFKTHQAIHYGDIRGASDYSFPTRTPNDTCPWKKVSE